MKKLLWILIIVIIGGVAAYFYVFHKPHRDVAGEDASYELKANELVSQYQNDQVAADNLYLDQVVAVRGKAVEVEKDHIKLENGVYGTLLKTDALPDVQVGDEVVIKGRIVGYDDLFGEVRLDNVQVLE